VETISVSGTGTPLSFKASLPQGSLYLLKAVGSVDVGGPPGVLATAFTCAAWACLRVPAVIDEPGQERRKRLRSHGNSEWHEK
jgi:hypothetical protein